MPVLCRIRTGIRNTATEWASVTMKPRYGKEAQSERLVDLIKVLKVQDGTISDFDGSLWNSMVELVTVGWNKEIMVIF